ncbi:hypothetical protein Ancab_003629 [Ancistrocladus abbreviatus]
MVTGWRRAFCTSIPKDHQPKIATDEKKHHNQQQRHIGNGCDTSSGGSNLRSPRFASKLSSFFSSSSSSAGGAGSNSSTPRLQTPPVSSPSIGCRTTATATLPNSASPVQVTPKLQCKTGRSSRFFQRSNPSSPRSPSTFSLLKNSLWSTKSRCGICVQGVKTGQGTAIFTAECSHAFHFPCLATYVGKHGGSVCPVCGSSWKEPPLLSIQKQHTRPQNEHDRKSDLKEPVNSLDQLRVYNDDEPLMSPTSGARFNPIPELDENDNEEDNETEIGAEEFQGFFVDPNSMPRSRVRNSSIYSKDIQVRISADAAVVAVGRSHQTYAVVLKVRAPPAPVNAARRASIDLVTVLDVGGSMTISKLQIVKRAMRLVISHLSSSDRLSIVAFSGFSKRLLPLRRMTSTGRRSARRITDGLVCSQGSCVNDALRKAAKVIQDRRERNPAASILLLSDGQDEKVSASSINQIRQSSLVSSTRFSPLEIPVHSFSLAALSQLEQSEEALAKCINSLLSIVISDLRLQLSLSAGSVPAQISAVYSCTGRPGILGSSSANLGDLYAEEEREILLELKVPSSAIGPQHVLSVRSCYKDPQSEDLIHGKEQALVVPRPPAVRSSGPGIRRFRTLFIMTRAVAESRRLVERNDVSGAHHLLSSARALLMQSGSGSGDECLRAVEAEMAELQCRIQGQPRRTTAGRREREAAASTVEKVEPLTPTSAWKAAERLAKVAIMRKSMNRVSDLHGFEDARF